MERDLRKDSERVVRKAISACLPDEAVRRALEGKEFPGRVVLISVGKAAWRMADAVWKALNGKISKGVVLTKYGHLSGPIGNLELYEAGHPVVDEASVAGTERILELVKGLAPSDTVLFLVSGGGSALFEKPLIPLSELAEVNRQLLACGDERHPKAFVRSKGRQVCGALPAGKGVCRGFVRCDRRPAGRDRFRTGGSGSVHLQRSGRNSEAVRSAAFGEGRGAAAERNA